MNLSHHAKGITNPEWIERFSKQLGGEDKFWEYVDNIYKLLDGLDTGQSAPVEKWCKPENYEFFIKIAVCYVSTSQCCYQFNQEYTIIKRQFDATEVERKLAVLAGKRKEQIAERNGTGTKRAGKRLETVSAPTPAV
jgi:hypothetical protein